MVNDDGRPRRRVLESKSEISIVIRIAISIHNVSKSDDKSEEIIPDPTKNMVMSETSRGKRPLQGTKLLVSIAIIRSRGESIILHPVTPTALHPKPMHIVKACLPQL